MDEASDDEMYGNGRVGVGHAASVGGAAATERETMLAAESNARRIEHETSGMREGYEVGKEETVQEGFDQGFQLASSAGFAWGKALGMAAMLGVETGLRAEDVKKRACDALWEEHGELKDRFPERGPASIEDPANALVALENKIEQNRTKWPTRAQ